ncbi:MAG: hypothetical protein AAF481_07260 [Acidobacteriota bacterium]
MPENPPPGDFYIGYRSKAPDALARFLKARVLVLLLAAAGFAALLAATQGSFDPGTFEFGEYQTLSGTLRERPVPLLEVERPGGGEPSRYPLIPFGKSGAEAAVAGLDGRAVTLEGAFLYRENLTFVELSGAGIEATGEAERAEAVPRDGDRPTLRGEIVDSKCFLGTMKPGRRKPHRACAQLCIRGGMPPLFVLEGTDGSTFSYLLTGPEGEAIHQQILDRVAEPVEITGQIRRLGDLWILAADPGAIRRLKG